MEIISQLQKQILEIFGEVTDSKDFYLTGGTALSVFYLKHRKSRDLDFFSKEEEHILPFSHHLEEKLKICGMGVERQRGIRSFVELSVKKDIEETVIHLAWDSPFRFEEVKEFEGFPGLNVDSLVDIACNKLLALFGRATLRDFIDIYFLIEKERFSPEELMDKAKVKDPGFDLYWLGVAFERINSFKQDSPEMSLLTETLDFRELANFFNQWRRKIAKELY